MMIKDEKRNDKLEGQAKEILEDHLQEYKSPVIACSWGKDSITVLHLLKQLADDFTVLWNDTNLHYPDIYNVAEELTEEWNLDVHKTQPDKTFWGIKEEYGWPGLTGSDRSHKANSKCCQHIKKKPTKEALKSHDWDLYIDGLTKFESMQRAYMIQEYGKSHYHKTNGIQKLHPIADWRVDDVWDYIEKYDIRYPEVYDNEIEAYEFMGKEVDKYTKRGYQEERGPVKYDRAIRSGCWTCTMTITGSPAYMKQKRVYYPNLWETLMKQGLADKIAELKMGGGNQGDLFRGYFNDDTREHWLDKRPCFFDTI